MFNTRYIPEAFIGLQEAYLHQLEDILEGLNSATEGKGSLFPTLATTPGSKLSLNYVKDWTYIGVGPNDGKLDGQFIPILYRKNTYTLLNFTNVWLSPTPEIPSKGTHFMVSHPVLTTCSITGWDAPYWNRVLTIGEFKHNSSGKKLVVMNTHLDDQGVLARKKSAEIIVDRTNALLASGNYEGALLTGDFNSEANEDAYRTIQFASNSPYIDVEPLFEQRDVRRQGHNNTYTVSTSLEDFRVVLAH